LLTIFLCITVSSYKKKMPATLQQLEARVADKPYMSGYVPSKDDQAILEELFGANTATIQWVARMASYYASERAELALTEKK
jgi:hypothetical protein